MQINFFHSRRQYICGPSRLEEDIYDKNRQQRSQNMIPLQELLKINKEKGNSLKKVAKILIRHVKNNT